MDGADGVYWNGAVCWLHGVEENAECQSDSHAERTSGEWIPSGRQVGTLLFPPVPVLEVVQG